MEEKTILFVDDDEKILHSLKRAMIDEPYRCLFASHTDQAFDFLRQNSVQTIVSDLCMPDMDGLMFLSEVRSAYPHIKRLPFRGIKSSHKGDDVMVRLSGRFRSARAKRYLCLPNSGIPVNYRISFAGHSGWNRFRSLFESPENHLDIMGMPL